MKNTSGDTHTTNAHEELETARKAVLEAYDSFLDAKKHLKKAAMAAGIDLRESANEQLDAAIARARDKKEEFQERTGDYVRDNPLTSASLAFLAGVMVSRIFGK
jgi:ElaB/YqjD/DUF883 family membrane-anchored ribosome-binding protein